VSGYIDGKRVFDINGSGTGFNAYDVFQQDETKQVTQELRLAKTGTLLDWVAGGFGYMDHSNGVNGTSLLQYLPIVSAGALPVPAFNAGAANQRTIGGAGFFNTTWHLLSPLDLVVGARVSTEHRAFTGFTNWGPQPLVSAFGLTNASSADLNPAGLTANTTNFSHKVAFNWKVTHDTLVYVDEAVGWKSGGFFSETSTSSLLYAPYKPERNQAFEVGAKWQQDRIQLDSAVFYYNYTDMQVLATNPIVPADNVVNVPKSRLYGLDLDATVLPFHGFRVQGSLGLLRSHLGAFCGVGFCDPAGNEATNAPKSSGALTARYEFLVTKDWMMAVQGGLHAQAHTWRDATNSPGIDSPGYVDYDARFSLHSNDDKWDIALWGKNLSDEQHRTSAVEARGLQIFPVYYSLPRTYGLEVSTKFE
jgi:iron complex outermembrane receptor protein